MAFARLDDGILDHPKFLEAGEEATDLFIRGVIWCNGKLTDGRIPKVALPRLTSKRSASKLVDKLLTVGAWIDGGDHWQIHDYLDWNESREEVLEKRRKARERMGAVRANKPLTFAQSSGAVRFPSPLLSTPTPEKEPSLPSGESPAAEPPPADAGPPRATPADLQRAWNTHVPALPEWREWPKKRAAAARLRCQERPLAELLQVVERVAASSFCRGENDRGWRADPDWLLRPGTAARVLEGKYDDREGRAPRNVRHGRIAAEDSQHIAEEGRRLGPDEF